MRALVTGAGGFVGRALAAHLAERGHAVRAVVRTAAVPGELRAHGVEIAAAGELGAETDWPALVAGVDVVFHLAARVHRMNEPDLLEDYRRANVDLTVALARAAAAAGAARLVFASSIKVNGDATADRPFTEEDAPQPPDAYSISKREAEDALGRVGAETGLQVAILRPPMVYGPGVRANFLALLRAVDRGIPLPVGSVRNRRSLVYRGNLVDALETCATHPAAAGQLFLVADAETVSTPDMVRRMARALGRPARLLSVPVGLLRRLAALTGRGATVARLSGSLEVDASRITRTLGWRPPHTMDAGLADTARWWRGGAAAPAPAPSTAPAAAPAPAPSPDEAAR